MERALEIMRGRLVDPRCDHQPPNSKQASKQATDTARLDIYQTDRDTTLILHHEKCDAACDISTHTNDTRSTRLNLTNIRRHGGPQLRRFQPGPQPASCRYVHRPATIKSLWLTSVQRPQEACAYTTPIPSNSQTRPTTTTYH